MADEAVRIVGFLVLYYPHYANAAAIRFASLLRALSRSSSLVIIHNSDLTAIPAAKQDVHVIRGDNTLREFSGWTAGIAFARDRNLITDRAILVFANDTFCHHNKFGPITRRAFLRTFRLLLQNPSGRAIAGEVHGGTTQFTILDKPFRRWVSTYLFAMTPSLLDSMGGLVPIVDMDEFFTRDRDPRSFLKGPINDNLARHVERWLFNVGGSTHWYGSNLLRKGDMEAFVGKAKSILCESYLSAHAASVGGQLLSVFDSSALQRLRRIETLFGYGRIRMPTG